MRTNIIQYLRDREALGTAIYYIITILTVILLLTMPQLNDGGPCDASTYIAGVFILAVLVTLILFFIYTRLLIKKGRKYRLPFLLHLCAVGVIILIFITVALLER